MSNRKNATMAQRTWRDLRKKTFEEAWANGRGIEVVGRDGGPVFFWRPKEVGWRITGIRYTRRGVRYWSQPSRVQIQAEFYHIDAPPQ